MLNYGEGRLIGTPQWSNILELTITLASCTNRACTNRVPGSVAGQDSRLANSIVRCWAIESGRLQCLSRNLSEEQSRGIGFAPDQNRPGGFAGGR